MIVVFLSGVLPCWGGDTPSEVDTLLWHKNKIVYFILEKTANKDGCKNKEGKVMPVGDNVAFMNSIVSSRFQLHMSRLEAMGESIGGFKNCINMLKKTEKITHDSINSILKEIKKPEIKETFPYEWYSKVPEPTPIVVDSTANNAGVSGNDKRLLDIESRLSNITFEISILIWLIIILLVFSLITISILFWWSKKGGKQLGSVENKLDDVSKLIEAIETFNMKILTNSLIDIHNFMKNFGDVKRLENVLKRYDDATGNLDVSVLMNRLNEVRNSILEAIVAVNDQDTLNAKTKACRQTEATHECVQSSQVPSTLIYCGFPDNNKIIRKAPDSSAERLVIEGSGSKASLSIVDKYIQTLIESLDSLNGCVEVREGSQKSGRNITILEKGSVEKVDDGWKVIKPIVIKFEV